MGASRKDSRRNACAAAWRNCAPPVMEIENLLKITMIVRYPTDVPKVRAGRAAVLGTQRANHRRSQQSDLQEGRGGGHRSRLIVRLIGFRSRLPTVYGPSGRLPSATIAGPRGIAIKPRYAMATRADGAEAANALQAPDQKLKAMDPEIARNQNHDHHDANDSKDVHSDVLHSMTMARAVCLYAVYPAFSSIAFPS